MNSIKICKKHCTDIQKHQKYKTPILLLIQQCMQEWSSRLWRSHNM